MCTGKKGPKNSLVNCKHPEIHNKVLQVGKSSFLVPCIASLCWNRLPADEETSGCWRKGWVGVWGTVLTPTVLVGAGAACSPQLGCSWSPSLQHTQLHGDHCCLQKAADARGATEHCEGLFCWMGDETCRRIPDLVPLGLLTL